MNDAAAAKPDSRAAKTRTRILEAAIEEFAAHGPDGARVDRIAARAGANKERLYAYFGAKSSLFAACLEQIFAQTDAAENAIGADAQDGRGLAERVLSGWLDIHEKHPQLWRLVAWANLSNSTGARLAPARAATYAALEKAFRAAQERGHYPKGVSFPVFVYACISLTLVASSNRRTLAAHLALDLDDAQARKKMVRELALLIERPAKREKAEEAAE